MKTNLELIDEVDRQHEGSRPPARGLDRNGRDLLEHSVAFLRETWISASGQKASTPEDLFKNVQVGLRISHVAEASIPEEGIEK